jgi:8-oxo-dGTP pyrophosphatase MutT (NUDIX family)
MISPGLNAVWKGKFQKKGSPMQRKHLMKLLQEYASRYPEEAQCIVRFRSFIRQNPQCFERTLTIGHITGSAWVVNKDGSRALLTHHKKLNQWLQVGGHADGNADVMAVAIREAQEESGIATLRPLSDCIFDIDIHRIPDIGDEPTHHHYDIRFLLQAADTDRLILSDESHALSWEPIEAISETTQDRSIARMIQKWNAWKEKST